MGKSKRFSVGFPPAIRKAIQQEVGRLGSSEAEVVRNMVLIYITEKGLLKHRQDKENKRGGDR